MHGWIINTEDLNEKLIRSLSSAGINELGIHPGGGKAAPALMRETLEKWKTPEYHKLISLAESLGITVEFDAHVLGYMLPPEEFDRHPDWFRMDESGARVPDHNMCVSNDEALEFISEKARETARLVRTNTHRYPFWPDDVTKSFCKCEKCRKLSPADQALIISNAFLKGIKKEDPEALVPFLAYYETLAVPQSVKPENGVYLEFAPIGRNSDLPINDEGNSGEAGTLPELIKFFGTGNSRVLEYWVDNSRFSNWTRPPKPMTLNAEVMRKDVEYYRFMGFCDMTSFACFLGDDYIELYGEPPIDEYGSILNS